jgi:hypothetical protein
VSSLIVAADTAVGIVPFMAKKKLGMAVVMTSVIHFYFGVKQSMLMQVFLSNTVFEPVINRSMLHVKAA